MTKEQQIIAVAKLKGFTPIDLTAPDKPISEVTFINEQGEQRLFNEDEFNSRDAIVLVIEKVCSKDKYTKGNFIQTLRNLREKEYQNIISDYWHIYDIVLLATASQLCEALLRAVGEWEE